MCDYNCLNIHTDIEMIEKIKNKWSVGVIGIFFFVTLMYVMVNGQNIYLQVHDYLDSYPAWFKMLSDNNLFWKTNIDIPFLGGIDRNYLFSDLSAYTWLFMIFPTFVAIIIGWYMKIIIAIIGFRLLAKDAFGDEADYNVIVFSGFLYGIIPSYPPCAFAFASLPLILWLVIRLYREFKWKYVIGLLACPILSDFAMFGIFICGYIALFFLFEWIITKTPKWRLILGLIAYSVGSVLVEWRLFNIMFFSHDASIRTTFAISSSSINEVMQEVANVFVSGYYHCGSLHKYIVLPVCGIYFLHSICVCIREHNKKEFYNDKLNWIFLWIIINCVIYGLDQIEGFKKLVATVCPPLTGFSFARTIWFNPFLWYFAFMIILIRMRKIWIKYILLIAAFCVLCLVPEMYNHIYLNIKAVGYEMLTGREFGALSYREFYSEKLFDKIKKDIHYDGEWSIAFGFHPSVIEYNGIASLDGYLPYYSVDYKNQFRKLIAPGLNVSPKNAEYFDDWGGRAYIFSDEIEYNPGRELEQDSAILQIDAEVFAEMNGKYVFSRVMVKNAVELGLKQLGVYTDNSSPYTIYVYEVC